MAAIRAAPRDDAEQVTQALAGEPLRVEEIEGDWARIRTAYDVPGLDQERRTGGRRAGSLAPDAQRR